MSIEQKCGNVSIHIVDVLVWMVAPYLHHHEKGRNISWSTFTLKIKNFTNADVSSFKVVCEATNCFLE